MVQRKDRWLRIAFGAYYAIMVYFLFLRRVEQTQPLWEAKELYWAYVSRNFNLIPFAEIAAYMVRGGENAVINLGGNILMFVPLGFFVPMRWENLRPFGKAMASCAAMILAVELVQLFSLLGRGDIDDLILNMLGAALGWVLCRMWLKRKKTEVSE